MKKFLHTNTLLVAIAMFMASMFVLSACKKDQTCGVKVTITDTIGAKQRYVWVILDIPENTPPSQTGNPPSDVFPLQLNTGTDGYVEAEFKLPAIIQANVYDSLDIGFVNPLKKKIIKLEAGETVQEVIEIE